MKWYQAITGSGFPNPFVAGDSDLKGFDEEDLRRARRVERWDPEAWFRAVEPQDDGELDDVLCEHLFVPVFSARLRRALQRARVGGIQYLPVKVFRPDGSEIKGYAIANYLHMVAALDFAKTKVVGYFPKDFPNPHVRGKIEDLRGVVLMSSRLKGRDVIRLREFSLRVYVSNRFRGVFDRGRFTGYSFQEVEVA